MFTVVTYSPPNHIINKQNCFSNFFLDIVMHKKYYVGVFLDIRSLSTNKKSNGMAKNAERQVIRKTENPMLLAVLI